MMIQVDRDYLVKHDVACTLECVTRELLAKKPRQPAKVIVKVLKDLRIEAKTRRLEDLMGTGEMSASEKTELSRQVGAIVSLERDESIASEGSAFSINSTDMTEFISDVREAYDQVSRTRVLDGRVTKSDLGDIIDLIAYPMPETLLSEMFRDVDADRCGAIDFTDCLALMSLRIQGRFHVDTLRPIYQSTVGEDSSGSLPRSFLSTALTRIGIAASETHRHLMHLCCIIVDSLHQQSGSQHQGKLRINIDIMIRPVKCTKYAQ
ncbi:hypothetical protein DIPPA_29170 [Diplonema papillatum]|nr:hypothetical protein DIPPA_29170 [Diplonema papillatum]